MDAESRALYYKKAFEKLEKDGKHTWNWAAFFFGPLWMMYRKMYLYGFVVMGFLGALFGSVTTVFLLFSERNYVTVINQIFEKGFLRGDVPMLVTFAVLLVIASILLGYFGNAIYREEVKMRIFKGYHKLEHFCPTSITSLLGVWLVIPADWYQKKLENLNEDKLSAKERAYTKENIDKYLAPRKPRSRNMAAAIWITILWQLANAGYIMHKHNNKAQPSETTKHSAYYDFQRALTSENALDARMK